MDGNGCTHTSSPFSPTSSRPASSYTRTAMPSARACSSPRYTGPIGLPAMKQPQMSVPPLTDASSRSAFTSRYT
jgi:hypothetical protein